MAFDADGMPFFMMRVAKGGESEYLVVAADLGEPPQEKREALYEMLLNTNTQLYGTQGIALGISPDTGEIILIGGLQFKGLEMEEFCKDLDKFVGKTEECREMVENFRPAAEEAPGDKSGSRGIGPCNPNNPFNRAHRPRKADAATQHLRIRECAPQRPKLWLHARGTGLRDEDAVTCGDRVHL